MPGGVCTVACDAAYPTCGCNFYCGTRSAEGTAYYCLNEAPCKADTECSQPGELCAELRDVCDDNGCRRQPFCGDAVCDPADPGCAGPGEPCNAGLDCYSGLCLGYEPPRCHAYCATDADCTSPSRCVPVTVDLGGGTLPVSLDLCVLPGEPCERDEDCGTDRVCGIEVSLDPICVTPLCTRGEPDCGDSGDPCGNDEVCYNRVCLGSVDDFHCHELCREDHHEDCDVEGQVCRLVPTLSGSMRACVTAGLPCKRDSDCTEPGEICGIGRTLDPECREAAGQSGQRVFSGEICNLTDRICYNNLCLGRMIGDEFRGTCYELCDPEKESSTPTCPPTQNCRVMQVKVTDGVVALDVCVSW